MDWKQLGDVIENTQKKSPFGRLLQDLEIIGCGSCLARADCWPSHIGWATGSSTISHFTARQWFSLGQMYTLCSQYSRKLVLYKSCHILHRRHMGTNSTYLNGLICFLQGKKGEFWEEAEGVHGSHHLLWELRKWQMILQRDPSKLLRVSVRSKCESKCDLQKQEKLENYIS